MDDNQERISERSSPEGVLNVKRPYAKILKHYTRDWCQKNDALPILIIGMAGSCNGCHETSYVSCPAALVDITPELVEVSYSGNGKAMIAPGLSCNAFSESPDLMRDEEIQTFGALTLTSTSIKHPKKSICLPRTHPRE